ncbi:hypothetical protein M9H77_06750 [Catharanthus roseus]|uniref:Uncharacterized protein n=1 Tax=Catharanthus roseus TaxID=4058 RepID=A0ACC0BSY6_CATRO|nr:hypothetical protein M9H77_06750 [Catharanthus roseus]
MASLRLSVSLDNSCEPKRLNFAVSSLKFLDPFSISLFSGYLHITGACVIRPFYKLQPIKVSQIDTEVLDTSTADIIDDLTIDTNSESFDSSNMNVNGDRRKGKFNIWKRYRGVRKVKKGPKLKSNFRKDNDEKGGEKPLIPQEHRMDSLLDTESVMDFGVPDFGPDLSSEQCNVILRQLESCSDCKALKFFEWMRENGKLTKNLMAYNLILRVLGRREEWNVAEEMIKEMTANSECDLNYQVFNTLIYACHKRGLTQLATKWFYMMLENEVRPNVATFGMVMSMYQKGWRVEEAEFAFAKMRALNILCHSAYSAMITVYTRLGLYDKAEEVIRLIIESEITLNLENWLVLLNAYSQQGKLDEAEKILLLMHNAGFPPNVVAYNTLITGYGKASNMDAAQRLFHDLDKVGLEPDETTYRSMIEGWGRANNYKEAKWYYAELKRLGLNPNSSNFYTMINLLAKHEDDEGILTTIDDMMMIGCQNSSILSIVLQAHEKAERFEKVPSILKGSLYHHILKNQISFSSLVMAYVKNFMVDDALKVLADKQWVDPIFEDNLYHLLICSCKELGNFENAIKIFTSMPRSNKKPNLHIFCSMIDIYSTMEMYTDAENLYLKLKVSDVGLDLIAFSVVTRMYAKSGSLKDACQVLDEVERQKIVPDVFLFRDMLRIYQRCGMLNKLANVYYKILKSGIVWDQEMYNCVINCCARALPVDELSKLFDEMLRRGYAPNTITFNVMLHIYGKSRLLKKARRVFYLARKRGLIDVVSYNTLIAAYGQNKYFKNMLSTVKKMEFNGFSVSLEAYNTMLDVYGKEGEMEKFRNVLQGMKESSCGSDQYTYNIMINIYGERGWIDEISGVLMELKEFAYGLDLCGYNTLIKAYGIAGMVEEAVDLVKEMRQSGIEPDRITYINLINALKKNDMVLEAVKWSLWMKQMRL